MPSPIDDLYKKMFGYLPKKAGAALERFAAIVSKMKNGAGDITHDTTLIGTHSGTPFQIDVLHRTGNFLSMGEAKDYSLGGEKVGRADIQKLVGALQDLADVNQGVFWSATPYTKPAQKYANASLKMNGKAITLLGLRPSTPDDESGFVRTIQIIGTHYVPLIDNTKWTIHWTENGRELLIESMAKHETTRIVQTNMQAIYDASGQIVTSIEELTRQGYACLSEDNVSRGCYWLPGLYVDSNELRVPIHGIEYEMPYHIHTTTSEITTKSPYRLVVTDEKNEPTRVLTEANIKGYQFDTQKNVILNKKS